MDSQKLWQAALGQLELQVSRGNFLAWFRDTHIKEIRNGRVIVETPSAFIQDWFARKYQHPILSVLKNLDDSITDVSFTIRTQSRTPSVLRRSSRIVAQKSKRPEPIIKEVAPEPVEKRMSTINPKYTFDSFVIGSNNEIAHAACRAVATRPGDSYNPLFLYGGVGLGKTHLMHAIGNSAIKNSSLINVLYVTSEKFTNDFIQALRDKEMKKFKDYYRNVDFLMIDDVQFLAGKSKVQEELFHTYNHLYSQNKQIILSSDRSPKALATFEERLRSRLTGGMLVDIQQPDYETRLAIIKEKAQESSVSFSPEALAYIAKNIQKNVRELEGALKRVIGHCEVNKKPATPEYTKQILSSIIEQPQQKTVDSQRIIEAVSTYYNLSLEDLCGKRRKQEIVRPRQVAMYLLRKENSASFPLIGQYFGGRDHTTAMHACEKITKLLEHDDELAQDINFIRERLYA